MPRSLLVLALVVLNAGGVFGQPGSLYVATNGNDSWSGKLPAPAADGKDGPFLTVPAALRSVRQMRRGAAEAKNGVTILIRGGRHELHAPLVLTPEDSGTSSQQPLTLAAFPGERPILSGGRVLRGWKRVSDQSNQWQVELPEVQAGNAYPRQLFVNGQRRQRARTPNTGFYRIQGPSSQDKPMKLRFQPGDLKRAWAEDGDVEVVALLAWSNIRMQIRSIDESSHTASLVGDPRPSNKEDNARFYVENAPDGLDEAGEWYLNRRTGVLTYWALPEEDLSVAEVIVPHLQELVTIQGDFAAQRPVRHVAFRGLTFSHTEWLLGPKGDADSQAAVAIRGDFLAEGMVDCLIEDCAFTQLAGYALELGKGCQRVQVVGCDMADLGAGGIRIGDTNKRPQPFESNHTHTVTDNHIHRAGVIYPPAVGILILQSGGNRIAHNHIHHLYYTAVSVGWNWGYQETPCRSNVIEFNHLHDIGQGYLSDMGGIYTLSIQQGTILRNNLVHDVEAFTYGGWGLYTDEGSTGITLENNVVYRCKSAGFHQHYGRDNVIRNNIFAFNREHQLMRTRPEAHISFYFTNNIVSFREGELLGSNWSNDNYRMNNNLYWNVREGGSSALKFAGATWEEWRARGHDTNSLVADPLFMAVETFDLRLRTNSPALRLGFKPIDLSRVGVRPKAKRR